MREGKLIDVDGADGSGKSTTLKYIKKWSRYSKLPIIFTKEPAGTQFGGYVRQLILSPKVHISRTTQAYLFAAARCDHIEHMIAPAMRVGKIVVCDRYLLSSLAYQSNYKLEPSVHNLMAKWNLAKHNDYKDINHIAKINQQAITYHGKTYLPNLNIYFNLDTREEIKRLNYRKGYKFDKFDKAVHNPSRLNHLRHNYFIALAKSKVPHLIINASLPPYKRAKIMWSRIKHLAYSNN